MNKSVLMSINKPYTDFIFSGKKTAEMRTLPPYNHVFARYKTYIYETKKYGGAGMVIGECYMTNVSTWRTCMGFPYHLKVSACVTEEEIIRYSDNGKKNITEINITDVVLYAEPKPLSDFFHFCEKAHCEGCEHHKKNNDGYELSCEYRGELPIMRAPQNWVYAELK